MKQQFQSFIQTHHLFDKNNLLLLAVSGGADSTCLCELCYQCGYHFEIAHCNFQLRGKESGRDEQFVRDLAKRYGVKSYFVQFHTREYAVDNKVSIEVAARELRYRWFDGLIRELKSQGGPPVLLTAHHRDDTVETLLMNFFKGTGIRGLTGIPVKNGFIRRPLLSFTKEQILNFLKTNRLSYVEDSTNNNDDFTRNYFRNQVIPSIEKVFPSVRENLYNNIKRFEDVKALYDQRLNTILERLQERDGHEIRIPVRRLKQTAGFATVLFEIVKKYGFTPHQSDGIIALLDSESGKYLTSSTHRVLKDRNHLIITPVETLRSANIIIEDRERIIVYGEGKIEISREEKNPHGFSKDISVASLDFSKIKYPLLLRRWKQGDYFYPLGMNKKKKLSRFFIDQKLSLADKERIWVIEMDKKIIWIVGHRIDNRFRITDKTTARLILKWTPAGK